ncbi:MAG: hypothetical protein LBU36_06625 [Clostridiales bacterium]|nr:hypothetical protein [Clostridiales bacterium]
MKKRRKPISKNLLRYSAKVRRTLAPSGTLWVNIGGSYAGQTFTGEEIAAIQKSNDAFDGAVVNLALLDYDGGKEGGFGLSKSF